MGGNSSDIGHSIAVHTNGDIYVGGLFMGSVDFDPGPDVTFLNTINAFQDGFIMKLSCGGPTAHHITTTICDTSYILNETVYTESGTYSQMYFATDGCDSMFVLNLTLSQVDQPGIRVNEFELSVTGSYATYQWLKNGTPIPGATSAIYAVTENADYQVVVTNGEGCTDTSDVYKVTNYGTSIDAVAALAKQIRVYPNPTEEILHIDAPLKVNATIMDIEGRTIMSIEDGGKNISLKGLAAGMYLLQVRSKEGMLLNTIKVIKQ